MLIGQHLPPAQDGELEAARHVGHVQQRSELVHVFRPLGLVAGAARRHAIDPGSRSVVGARKRTRKFFNAVE